MTHPTRRDILAQAAALLGAGTAGFASPLPQDRPKGEPFKYCLNTSTIRGQKLGIADVVDIAARAGYSAIEPWIDEIDRYAPSGASLKDLEKRIRDHGLSVESAIGFAEWIVDDDARRAKGMEQVRRDMDLVARIGGKRIAAPPAGATGQADLDLRKAAERYRALLELGERMGVVPELELWGSSKCLSRLGEVVHVALEAGHPRACLLLDLYHLHKGGSGYGGLRSLNGGFLHVIHTNDYPADPPREKITDAHRVYPGDGVAPLRRIFRDLDAIGYRGCLSLELFNRDYWKEDAAAVAKTGLEKMRAAVRKAFE